MPHFEPGTTLGPYRIDELVGSGGMGDVYRATDTRLHRRVAIKLIAPDFSTNRDFQTRFEREARLLAALNHRHVGAIHGIEQFDGVHALVLELVEGKHSLSGCDTGRAAAGRSPRDRPPDGRCTRRLRTRRASSIAT